MSVVRKQFEHCIPRWIRRLTEGRGQLECAAVDTRGHSDFVKAVAFSPDDKTLASASNDMTVKLYDAGSGAVLQTLGVFKVGHRRGLLSGRQDAGVGIVRQDGQAVGRWLGGATDDSPLLALSL
jgi:WD40 repeat protein